MRTTPLDALDVAERQMFDRGRAGGNRIHAQAVDQHQGMVGLAAAQADRGLRAEATGLRDFHARQALQQTRQVERGGSLDVAAGQHGGGGQRIGQFLRCTGRGDDDFVADEERRLLGMGG